MTDEELRQLFEAIRHENAAAHEETRRVMRRENAVDDENRRSYFDATVKEMRKELQLVAEGVLQVDSKIDRTADQMRHGFSETQAMIKFSYAELDRRVSSLEERVDRLEAAKPH